MSIKNASKLFLGSIFVYVAMASCVASERATAGNTATTGTNGAGGSMMAGNGGVGGILDPVPDASAETSNSGSRLKARRHIAEDGAISDILGWHDSKRNEDCGFRTATDSALRCMPGTSASVIEFYTDAACTIPKLAGQVFNVQCAPEKYVFRTDTAGCLVKYALHNVLNKIDATILFSKKSDGTCVQFVPLSFYDYHDIGPEIHPTEFVAATLVTDP